MKRVHSQSKSLLGDSKWLSKALGAVVISSVSAIVAAFGIKDVDLKAQIRPLLMQADFFEVSVVHQDTEALIKRIQDIQKSQRDHALIRQLRMLSKEGDHPFLPYLRDVLVRRSTVALPRDVGVVCRNSDLRDTYLMHEANPSVGMVILKIEGKDTCNRADPDQLQVTEETWARLGLGPDNTKLKGVDVHLHPPVGMPALSGEPAIARSGAAVLAAHK
jgi:hypothetical protein